MKINGWELENGRATFLGRDGIVASVSWIEDVAGMVEEIRSAGLARQGRLSSLADDGDLFQPGLYIRMTMAGAPKGIIMVPRDYGDRLETFTRECPAEEFLEEIIMTITQKSVLSRPMDPGELEHWMERADGPDCPGGRRFRDALAGVELLLEHLGMTAAVELRSTPQERDNSSLITWRLGLEFHEEGARQLLRASEHGHTQQELEGFLRDAIWAADTRRTMGIMIRRFIRAGVHSYALGMLVRDPDWIGMDPVLDGISGLEATVLGSAALPGEPGIIMAMEHSAGSDEPPGGPVNRALREMLERRGIRRCRWK